MKMSFRSLFLPILAMMCMAMVPDGASASPNPDGTIPASQGGIVGQTSENTPATADADAPAEVTSESLLARVEALLKRGEQWIIDNLHAMVSTLEGNALEADANGPVDNAHLATDSAGTVMATELPETNLNRVQPPVPADDNAVTASAEGEADPA